MSHKRSWNDMMEQFEYELEESLRRPEPDNFLLPVYAKCRLTGTWQTILIDTEHDGNMHPCIFPWTFYSQFFTYEDFINLQSTTCSF